MNPKASLEDLVEYFGMLAEDCRLRENCRFYFDRQSGEVLDIEEPVMKAVAGSNQEVLAGLDDGLDDEPEMAREILSDKGKRFVQLPDNSQWDEAHVKEEFIRTVQDERIAAKLARTMKRDVFGLFRFSSFAGIVYRFGLEEDWHKFRVETIKRRAIEWAEANHVPYEDDVTVTEPTD